MYLTDRRQDEMSDWNNVQTSISYILKEGQLLVFSIMRMLMSSDRWGERKRILTTTNREQALRVLSGLNGRHRGDDVNNELVEGDLRIKRNKLLFYSGYLGLGRA